MLLVSPEYGLRLASHIFVKDISPESLAARDGNIQEGDVVLKVSFPYPEASLLDWGVTMLREGLVVVVVVVVVGDNQG